MNTTKRKYFLLLWVIVCVFALLACGIFSGGSTEESAPTEVVGESGESESVESQPEGAEPPVDEIEQPSDGVQEPEVESPPEEDESPMNESGSSAESDALADSGDGWGESNSPAQSACDNPYFPMREGATWEYEDNDGLNAVWTVTEVSGDLDHAATMEIVIEDVTLTYHWECEAGGSMVSYDYVGITADTGDVEMTMDVVEGSGQFLPAWDDLQIGYSWDLSMKSVLSFTMDVEGLDSEMLGTVAMTQTHEVIGEEPVTIDGITADGVQVEVEITSTVTMDVMGISVPSQTTEMTELLWLGYGIGLVRQETLSEFGKVELVLKSFYIP